MFNLQNYRLIDCYSICYGVDKNVLGVEWQLMDRQGDHRQAVCESVLYLLDFDFFDVFKEAQRNNYYDYLIT